MLCQKYIRKKYAHTGDRSYLGLTVAVSVIVGRRRWRDDVSVLYPVSC